MRWTIEDAGIGAVTLSDAATEAMRARLAALRAESLVTVLDGTDDLAEARELAKAWRRKSDLTVVIGSGGASLGAQTLIAIAPERERVCFLDNIDPDSLTRMLEGHELTRVTWLIVSKSGQTVETLATLMAVMGAYAQAGLAKDFVAQAAVISGLQDSPLRELATKLGMRTFAHPEVGGRYSVFTLVGLLPAEIAGLDGGQVRQGAIQWLAQAEADGSLFRQCAWLKATMTRQPVHVVMPYADTLKHYTRWFQQLWAESLGKGGQGSTPFAALGTVDQHSQLQLFLDGPRDKSFTLVLPKQSGLGPVLQDTGVAALAYLAGHRIGDVMAASAQAIATTMGKAGIPLRILRAEKLDAAGLGELLMRHMVETILVAVLMGVDPYGQPAVEEGKKLTRQYLS